MINLQILTGDSLTILPTLAAESVQSCVTSPPYWGLRDYEQPAQIGAESSPEIYVENLVALFQEVRRVLRKDGTVWLNVGDGYARNGGTGNCGPNAVVGNTKKLIQKRNCKVPDCWGLKDRDLLGLPWRVAFALQADGWILRSKITWIKKMRCLRALKTDRRAQPKKFLCLPSRPSISTIRTAFEKKAAQTFVIIGFSVPTQAEADIRQLFRAS